MYTLVWYILLIGIVGLYAAAIGPVPSAVRSNVDVQSKFDVFGDETGATVTQTKRGNPGEESYFMFDDEDLSDENSPDYQRAVFRDYKLESSESTSPQNEFAEEYDEDDDDDDDNPASPVNTTPQNEYVEELDEEDDQAESNNSIGISIRQKWILVEYDEDGNDDNSSSPVNTTPQNEDVEELDEEDEEFRSDNSIERSIPPKLILIESDEDDDEAGSNNSIETSIPPKLILVESDEDDDDDDDNSVSPVNTTPQNEYDNEEDEEFGSDNSIETSMPQKLFFEESYADDDEELDEDDNEGPTISISFESTDEPESPSTSTARRWSQCGGLDWKGPKTCEDGFECFAASIWYSQCRIQNRCPRGWACNNISSSNNPVSRSKVIKAYHQCSENAYAKCQNDTYCFRRTTTISLCMPACPSTWQCKKDRVPLYGQCGGENHLGLTKCADGLTCFKKSQWYSNCHKTCPKDTNYECAKKSTTQ